MPSTRLNSGSFVGSDLVMTKVSASDFRRWREHVRRAQNLAPDAWIAMYSLMSPKKLHALGVITFWWNACEYQLFGLFVVITGLPDQQAWILAHELGAIALMDRINALAAIKLKKRKDAVELIANTLDIYEICRRNRNQLTHFSVGPAEKGDIQIRRKSKAPDSMEPAPFPNDLKDIRRVARDVRRLHDRLFETWAYAQQRLRGRRVKPSPKILPLPELLWKPPQQAPKERPPRRSSRA